MLFSEDLVQQLMTPIESLMSIFLFQDLNTDSSFSSRRTVSDHTHTHTHAQVPQWQILNLSSTEMKEAF